MVFPLPFLSNVMIVIKKVLQDSEIEQATAEVSKEVNRYQISINTAVTAMQAAREKEKEEQRILEWICSSNGTYLTPKRPAEVKDTCQAFLKSKEYLSWTGSMPSTLICQGRRTHPSLLDNTLTVIKLGLENHIFCTLPYR